LSAAAQLLVLLRVSMPFHAERDIFMANLYVFPSVCHMLLLYRNEGTHQTFFTIWYGHDFSF